MEPEDNINSLTPPEDNSGGSILDLLEQEEAALNKAEQAQKDAQPKDNTDWINKGSETVTSFSKNRLDEIQDKDINVTDAYKNPNELDQKLYDKQGWMEMTGRAVGGGLYKGVATALENIGYMTDLPQMMKLTDDLDKGYSNWLSESMSDIKKEYDDANPIYSQGFGDLGWAAQLVQSGVDSTVGFAVPGGIAGNVIGRGANIIGQLIKANAIAVDVTSTAMTALMTNYAESMMMSQELWKDIHDQAIAKGISKEEASKMATTKAEEFRFANKINFVTDAIALKGLVTGKSLASGAAQKSKLAWAKGAALNAVGEGFEEGLGGFQQGEYTREGLEELGVQKKTKDNVLTRAYKYASSDEGLTEILSGLASGPFQAAGAKGISSGVNLVRKQAGWENGPGKDPGEFTEAAPTEADFELKGERPVTPEEPAKAQTYEEYLKENHASDMADPVKKKLALTNSQWKENYNTSEEAKKVDQAAYDAVKESLKPWEKFDAAVTKYNTDKEAHENLRKKYNSESEAYEQSKNAGKITQTKKEVSEFLKAENKLAASYEQAVRDGDEASIFDIENARFENLFHRHVKQQTGFKKSTGDGSLESQLEAAIADPNLTSEQKKIAERMKDKMPGMLEEWTRIYGKHGMEGTQDAVWKAKVRMDNTLDVVRKTNEEVDKSLGKLAKDVKDMTGGDVSPYDMDLVKMRAEMVALMQTEKTVLTSPFVDSKLIVEMETRKKALENRINTFQKQQKENEKLEKEERSGYTASYKAPLKEIEAHASMEQLRESMNQQALSRAAFDRYKNIYTHLSKDLGKDLKKANNELISEHLDNPTRNNVDEARAFLDNLDIKLSPKDRKALEKKWNTANGKLVIEQADAKEELEAVTKRREYMEETTNEARSLANQAKVPLIKSKEALAKAKKRLNQGAVKELDQDMREEFGEDFASMEDMMSNLSSDEKDSYIYDLSNQNTKSRLEAVKEAEQEVAMRATEAKITELRAQEYEHLLKHTPKPSDLPGMGIQIEFNADTYYESVLNSPTGHTSASQKEAAAQVTTDTEEKAALQKAANAQRGSSTIVTSSIIPVVDSEGSNMDSPQGYNNAQEEEFGQTLPQNLQYASHTYQWENIPGSTKKKDSSYNEAIAEWMETTGDLDKTKDYTLEYEIDPADLAEIKISPDKIYTTPIKMYVLNSKNERVVYGEREVFGYVTQEGGKRSSEYNKYAKVQRDTILAAIQDGVKLKPRIVSVGKGTLHYKEGVNNNLAQITERTGAQVQLAISDGEFLDIGGRRLKDKDGREVKQNLTRGFAYSIEKTLNGTSFPLKLNSRKLRKTEIDTLYQMIEDIFYNKKGFKDKVEGYEHISGLTYGQAINLLVFEDAASESTAFPFKLNFSDGNRELWAGSKKYPGNEIADNQAEIKAFLGTMWRTTRSDMINKPLRDGGISDKFTWFNSEYDPNANYNDFVFNDGALSTNALAPEGRLFTKPYIEMTDIAGQGVPAKVEAKPEKETLFQQAQKVDKRHKVTGPGKGAGNQAYTKPPNAEEQEERLALQGEEALAQLREMEQERKDSAASVDATQTGKKKGEAKKEPVTEQPSSSVEEVDNTKAIAELEEQRDEELGKAGDEVIAELELMEDIKTPEEYEDKATTAGEPIYNEINARYDAKIKALKEGITTNKPKLEATTPKVVTPSKTPNETSEVATNEVVKPMGTRGKGEDVTGAANEFNANLYNDTDELFSLANKKGETVNIEKESREINKMIPNVPSTVHRGLLGIPGGYAEGMFYNGLITLSDAGKRGVAYHEAFHAVSQMYLSKEQREAMYDEARALYGSVDSKGKPKTDRDIEEDLAEGFRAHMIDKGTSRMANMPKAIKWLYEALMDLVEAFTNKKKRHIFDKIREGRYHYKPINKASQDILYSIHEPGHFVRAAVDGIVYNIVQRSNLTGPTQTKSIDQSVLDATYNRFSAIQASAIKKGAVSIAKQYELVALHWDDLVDLAKIELASMGITEKKDDKDTVEDEVEAGEGLNIKNAFEYSGKDNAMGNAKLMVRALQEPNAVTTSFGKSMPKLASYNKSWALLEKHLTDIVDNPTSGETAQDLMLKKLKDIRDIYPPFKELVYILENPNTPLHKKTQFYSAFHRQNAFFVGSTGRVVKAMVGGLRKGVEWIIGDADSKRKGKRVVEGWEDVFRTNFIGEDGLLIPSRKERVEKAIGKFNGMHTAVKDPEAPYFNYQIINGLTDVLNSLGMDISTDTVESYMRKQDGVDEDARLAKGMENLQFLFKDKDVKRASNAPNLTKYLRGMAYDPKHNPFLKQRGVKVLGEAKGEESLTPGEGGITMPDGTVVYPKSQNHHMSKSLASWNASGGKTLSVLLGKEYHRYSEWGEKIIEQYLNEGKTSFRLGVFGFDRLDDGRDMGDSASTILDADDMINRMVNTLNGSVKGQNSIYTPLTYADKSSVALMQGMDMTPFNMGDGNVSYEATRIFSKYAMAEIQRISKVVKLTQDPDSDFDIKYFSQGGGTKSTWFPDLSFKGKLAEEIGLYSKNGMLNLSEDVLQKIDDHVNETLLERVQEETKVAEDFGIIKDNEVYGVSQSIQKAYFLDGKNKARINNMMADYTLNSMMANIEFTMLFAGDPGFYKDLPKRTPSNVATGDDLLRQKGIPSTFNLSVMKDLEKQSTLYDEYVEVLGHDKATPYRKSKDDDGMNVGDAQGFITPERFKHIMMGLGKWDESVHSKAFNKLMKGSKSKEDLSTMHQLLRDIGMPSGQPLKGVHFELRQDATLEMAIPTFLKYSQAVLWPGFIAGTKLEGVYKSMTTPNKDGKVTDELVFESGVKVGATNRVDFGENMDLRPVTLDNYGWKLQQDLPAKYDTKGKALVGSQPKKNILANLKGRKITWNGEEIDGEKFAEKVHLVESMLSDEGVKKLTKSMGIDENGYIKDVSKTYEKLKRKLQEDKASNNVINQLASEAPFDAIFQLAEKVDSEIHAGVTAETVKLKAPGGSFIQTSNVGMAPIKPEPMNKEQIKDLTGIIYLQDISELRGARRNKDKKTISADVFLPFKAIEELLEKNADLAAAYKAGTLTGEKIKEHLGDTTENLVGYRIPNQGLSSIDTLNIAGILPASMGDSIVTYSEVTAKTGSDFDIDKMYVMMYNTDYNEETGKMERIPSSMEYFDDAEAVVQEALDNAITPRKKKAIAEALKGLKAQRTKGLENLRTELWSAILKSSDTYADLITPLDSEFLKNDAYFIAFLEEVRDATDEEKSKIYEIAGISSFDAFLKSDDKVSIANDYFSNKPLKALEFASPSHQQQIKKRNMAGKAGVGQTANHLTHHPLGQLAKLNMAYIGIGNKTKDGKTDLSGTYINEKNGKGSEQITEVISAWLNAYVDNAKDPYISLINNNTETANTVFMLLRAGVDPEWVNRFMSQPIIKEYVEATFASKSKNIRPEAKEKSYITYNEAGEAKVEKTTRYFSFSVDDNFDIIGEPKDGPLDAIGKMLDTFEIDHRDVDRFTLDVSGNLENYTTEMLESNIAEGGDPMAQFELLKEFLVLQKRAEKLNDAVNASKSDTKGAFGGSAENLQARERYRQVLEEGHVGNFDVLFNETMLGAFYENGTVLGDKVASKLLLSKSQSMADTIKAFMDRQGLGDYATNKKTNQALMSSARSYMYGQTDMFSIGPKERLRLFSGNTAVANRLKAVKAVMPDNILLDYIHSYTDEAKMSFITADGMRGMEQMDIDLLWQSWEELLSSDKVTAKGESVKKWAEDLVQYAFYSSGFKKGLNSIFDLIPSSYMEGGFNDDINTFLKRAQQGGIMESFIDQFVRHNYDDSTLIPQVKAFMTEDRWGQSSVDLEPLSDKYGITSTNGFKAGIKIKEGELFPEQFKKSQEGPIIHPVRYINIANEDDSVYLYEYVGRDEKNNHVYEALQHLGMKDKGNKIVEYGDGFSDVTPKVAGIKSELRDSLVIVQESDQETLGVIEGSGTTRSFSNGGPTVKVEERVINGVTLKVALLQTNGRPVMMGASDTIDKAFALANNKAKKMGNNKVQRIVNQPC